AHQDQHGAAARAEPRSGPAAAGLLPGARLRTALHRVDAHGPPGPRRQRLQPAVRQPRGAARADWPAPSISAGRSAAGRHCAAL
nr:hypothetical protein [Tanacetum cinerariifolium]